MSPFKRALKRRQALLSQAKPNKDNLGAIAVHHTGVDKDGAWVASANLKALGDSPSKDSLVAMHAWVDPEKDGATKGAYKLPHHKASDGHVGDAVMKGVASAMGRLNGGGLDIPESDRRGVYDHLAAHYKDAGMDPPEFEEKAAAVPGEYFGMPDPDDPDDDQDEDEPIAEFEASSADPKTGTIDCVWYGGATVLRQDYDTGEPYGMNLDMAGCRIDRLNAGAPVFDCHFSGDDFPSMIAGKAGTKAQVGVVQKAWTDGKQGKATLRFDMANPDAADLFRKAATGIVNNLSFGAWIYKKEKMAAGAGQGENPPEGAAPYSNPNEMGMFTATDWEPFEISPVTVPADFSTQFLSAAEVDTAQIKQKAIQGERLRVSKIRAMAAPFKLSESFVAELVDDGKSIDEASKAILAQLMAQATAQPEASLEQPGNLPTKENIMTPNPGTGAGARTEADIASISAAAIKEERARVAAIRNAAAPFKQQLTEEFVQKLVDDGKSIDDARTDMLTELSAKSQNDADNKPFPIRSEVVLGRDKRDKMREQMEAALLFRYQPQQFKELAAAAQEFRGLSLLDLARECLAATGINVRGMSREEVARRALSGQMMKNSAGGAEYFMGAETTSDFPAILANVANKTLRQAYEAEPRTFQSFCRQVTATDFKPINRVQLSDAGALQKLNEKGEYHRANLTDSNQNYSLATYGEVVAITRKVIINDDLQAFTRIPALLGVAAARLESDVVWAVVTGNQVMQEDSLALFHATHNNLLTGGGSAVGLTALGTARAKMRLQKGPGGTILNLTPRFIIGPAALETSILQIIAPMNIASTDVTKVVPEWVRSMVPVIEPRLDAASTTAWYLSADPANIDTIEYCYLEGQQGVYLETRQGFEVDGVEMKARLDFAAAAIDYRGLQENAGA